MGSSLGSEPYAQAGEIWVKSTIQHMCYSVLFLLIFPQEAICGRTTKDFASSQAYAVAPVLERRFYMKHFLFDKHSLLRHKVCLS